MADNPTPDIPGLLKDPNFNALPLPDQLQTLQQLDPSFVGHSLQDYQGFRQRLNGVPFAVTPNNNNGLAKPSDVNFTGNPTESFVTRLQQANPVPALKAIPTFLQAFFGGPTASLQAAKQINDQMVTPFINSFKGGNLENIPIAGPIAEDLKHGDLGGLTGDAASLVAQIFGPKVMEGANIPTRAVGDAMYDAGMSKIVRSNPDIRTLGKLDDVVDFAKQNRISTTQAGQDRVQQLINEGMSQRDAIAQAHGQTPISGLDIAQPLVDLARTYIQAEKKIPQVLLDRIDHVVGKGTRNLLTWQNQKQALSKLIKEGSPISGKDIEEKSLETAMDELEHKGLQRSIAQYAPGIDEANRGIHLAVLLKKSLENYLLREPKAIETVAPLVAAAAAEHLTPGPGGPGFLTTPITAAGMAGYATRAAIRNPKLMSRLGLVLDKAGYGPLSTLAGQSPKLGILNSVIQPTQKQ